MTNNPADKIIVALDGMDSDNVFNFIKNVKDLVWVKIGLELFVQTGPDIIKRLKDMNLKIFLDLKFHDIPATMGGACRRAAFLGAELISVHACAGSVALKEAQDCANEGANSAGLYSPTLLGITVLTSWSGNKMQEELAIRQGIKERVLYLTRLSKKIGLGGCVCSPKEIILLRKEFPLPFMIVTPGIRRKGSSSDDQIRIENPAEAIRRGASKLVIGRPITKSESPEKEFSDFCEEILSA